MSYVVYVNHPTSKARVHNIDCSEYRNRKADETENGYWSEEHFQTVKEAMTFAKSTGKADVSVCSKCC